jgi:branched-chain amino acid transport system substrate-binding protein
VDEHQHKAARAIALVAVVAMLGLAVNVVTAGAQSEKPPGVTVRSVKIGFIYNGTGAAASSFKNAAKAFQARIDRANAEGGVNGRKIVTEIVDDKTSGANLTAAKDLVENRKVFTVVNDSGVGFLAYRYLLDAGIPAIGGGFDGAYYSEKGIEGIIPAFGYLILPDGLVYNTGAKFAKSLGAKKMATIAVNTPGSVASTKTFMDYAPRSVGMEGVYSNTALDLGTTDVGSPVLGMKQAGADAVYMPITSSTVVAIMDAIKQNDLDVKAAIGATGYGQDLLDSPAATSFGPSDVFSSAQAPVELETNATKRFRADLKKYAGLTGVPDYGQYTGYVTADLTVLGLQLAGKDLTRQGFSDAIREHGDYDGAGLFCQPVDLSLEAHGKFPNTSCTYFLNVKDGKFVVLNKGKPVVGKLVGTKEALEANATGNPSLVTTTTAAP